MDLEMTGLNARSDRIMEVICVITDNVLNVVAEGPRLVIHQSDARLNNMEEWCKTTHTKVHLVLFMTKKNLITENVHLFQTGLWDECQKSTTTVEQAESELLKFLQQNNIKARECPLAGNTIYMDRLFLKEYMPKIDEFLHYRLIDVSTCKELCKRWNPKQFSAAPKKRLLHRGYEDIMESIEELKYYKQYMFSNTETTED